MCALRSASVLAAVALCVPAIGSGQTATSHFSAPSAGQGWAASPGDADSEEVPLRNWAAPLYWLPPSQQKAPEAFAVAGTSAQPSAPASAVLSTPMPLITIDPCRLVDTRGNGYSGQYGPPSLTSRAERYFQITGQCGIPAGALAVSFEFTAVNMTSNGNFRAWPQGGTMPTFSVLNWTATSGAIGNGIVVPISSGGGLAVYVNALVGNTVDLVLDVDGYFAPKQVVTSVNGISGDLTLASGTGILLGQLGQTLTISTTAQGSTVVHDASLIGAGVTGSPLGVSFSGTGTAPTAARADHNHDLTYQKAYARTVVVSPVGTPAQNGDALRSALAGITTATVTNPWLVKIEPGVYDVQAQTISMVPYVDIEGSGEGVTTITGGAYYYNGATLWASNAELRFVTVETYGSGVAGGDATALYNPGFSTRLLHVTLRAHGGPSFSYGMWNTGGSADSYVNVLLRDVTILATGPNVYGATALKGDPYVNFDLEDVSASADGGSALYFFTDSARLSRVSVTATGANAFAIYCYQNCNLVANDVDVTATGAAFYNQYATVDLTNVRGTVTGGSGTAYGIFNLNTSMQARYCVIAASGGVASYGVFNELSGLPGPVFIDHCSLAGGTNSLSNSTGTAARVAETQLIGPTANTGTLTCAAVYDGNYTFYPSSCP